MPASHCSHARFRVLLLGGAGVVACNAFSVIRAEFGRVGVTVVRSGLAGTAGCGHCKSKVTGRTMFSHRPVLAEVRHVHSIADLALGLPSGVLVHPRRIEHKVGASCGVLVLPCRTERAVGCSLALCTLPRHMVRAKFQCGGVATFGFFELASLALLTRPVQGVVAIRRWCSCLRGIFSNS